MFGVFFLCFFLMLLSLYTTIVDTHSRWFSFVSFLICRAVLHFSCVDAVVFAVVVVGSTQKGLYTLPFILVG